MSNHQEHLELAKQAIVNALELAEKDLLFAAQDACTEAIRQIELAYAHLKAEYDKRTA